MSQDLKNKMGIYQIINIIDGKRYIGSSNNLHKRRLEHFNRLKNNKHVNYYLQNAYNKYSLQNFKFEVLEFVKSEDLLLSREQYYIELYQVCDRAKGYNLIVDATRNMPSEETRKKMSEAKKGKCTGKNNSMYGKSHSLETRKKMSEANKGKSLSLETRKKISEANKGKHTVKSLSLEARKKMSEAKKSKTGILHHSSKKVICLETGVVYGSMREAERLTGICHYGISKCCKGQLKTTGKCHWQYYQK